MTHAASKTGTLVIFINQLREKIGVMYGSPEYTPGGKALPYYASIRLDIRRTQTVKQGDVATANSTRVKVVKNKVAPPFRQAEFDIEYGVGVSKYGALIDCAAEMGLIRRAGAYYNYEGENIGQGKEKTKSYLMSHPDVYDDIYSRVMESVGVKEVIEEVLDDDFA